MLVAQGMTEGEDAGGTTARPPARARPRPLGGPGHFRAWPSAGLLLLALLPALVGALALGALANLQKQSERLVSGHLARVALTRELTTASNRAARSTRDYLLTADPSYLRERRLQQERHQALLEESLRLGPPERNELVRRVQEAWQSLSAVSEQSVAIRQRTGRVVGETERFLKQFHLPAREALEQREERLARYDAAHYEEALASYGQAQRWTWHALVATLALLAVGGCVTSALTWRWLRSRGRDEAERQDLLERERQTRAEAEEGRALLDLVVQQSADGIVVADATGLLRLVNRAAEEQHGKGLRAVPPQDWGQTYGLLTEAGHPLPLEQTPLYRALQGERVIDARWRVRRPDGALRNMIGTASPLWRSGRLAGAVLSTRDDTERLALEADRDSSWARLNALFEGVPIGLGFVDSQYRYVRVNEALAEMNGRPAAEHIGRTLRDVLGPAAARLEPLVDRVWSEGRAAEELEFSERTLAGPPRRCLLQLFPVRSASGGVIGVGASVVDVTALKRAEEQLRDAVELRDRFNGILGHDLRNPLHAVTLSARALLMRGDLSDPARRAAQRISTSAERMAKMIEELLDVTRIRLGGGLHLAPRPLDLIALCEDTVEEVRAGRPESDVLLEAQGDGAGCWDGERLSQVVSNLVSNAIEHGEPGTPVQVTLDGQAPSEIVLAVHNQGATLAPEEVDELFAPFRQGLRRRSDRLGAGAGLGLGLYITREVVTAHQGSIEVESAPDRGTTFRVHLPRTQGVSGGCPS